MADQKKHSLTLKGFELENGKISFRLLAGLSEQLTRLAKATLLSYVEGSSKIKKGKAPDWLLRSVDFSLTSIRAGSTVLSMEAPVLSDCIGDIQLPVFQDFDANRLKRDSALDLSFFAYEQALNEPEASHLLDKNLLREILKLKSVLGKEKTALIYQSGARSIEVSHQTLSTIQVVEEKTPASVHSKVLGKLDVLQHSNARLEIITGDKKIRAKLTDQLSFNDVFPLFGKDIVAKGIFNFNPAGNISLFEIDELSLATESDAFFKQAPQPIFQEFDLERIAAKASYTGTALHTLLGHWPGDETTDDLLQMLKE
ncbi:MAG: hypothetical protein NXI25_07845 [bacterium]|jgi:hypothetical protein|nr:hypothetical protein [bacterium]